jgi:hypothetical protein
LLLLLLGITFILASFEVLYTNNIYIPVQLLVDSVLSIRKRNSTAVEAAAAADPTVYILQHRLQQQQQQLPALYIFFKQRDESEG